MRIKKIYQGALPENKIVNGMANSDLDTYSCNYINQLVFDGVELDVLPLDSVIEYEGDEIPDGWEVVEEKELSAISATYSAAVAGTSGNWKIPETNVTYMYPINNVVSQQGSNLVLDTEKNCIVVGEGISRIFVHTKVTHYTTSSATDLIQASYIFKNGNLASQTTYSCHQNKYQNINDAIILDVVEGDEIQLGVYGQSGDQIGRNTNTIINVVELPSMNVISQTTENLDSYSTEETIVGTWINGKPIYRKVIQYVGAISKNTDLPVADLGVGIENLVRFEHFHTNSLNTNIYISYAVDATKFGYFSFKYNRDRGILYCTSWNDDWSSTVLTMIVEYTKTTD